MKEAHGGPLPGHFGINKTLEYLRCTFIGLRWVRVHIRSSQDVTFTIWLEVTSIKASKLVFWFLQGLNGISMDFIVATLRTPRGKHTIMVVVDWFSKIAYFISFHGSNDATQIVDIFF